MKVIELQRLLETAVLCTGRAEIDDVDVRTILGTKPIMTVVMDNQGVHIVLESDESTRTSLLTLRAECDRVLAS